MRRACWATLSHSGLAKLHPLVLSVFFRFIFPAGRIHEAGVSEKQKKCAVTRIQLENLIHFDKSRQHSHAAQCVFEEGENTFPPPRLKSYIYIKTKVQRHCTYRTFSQEASIHSMNIELQLTSQEIRFNFATSKVKKNTI